MLGLPDANPGTVVRCADEFDAGGFKGRMDCHQIGGSRWWYAVIYLNALNCTDAQRRMNREFAYSPPKCVARASYLCTSNH